MKGKRRGKGDRKEGGEKEVGKRDDEKEGEGEKKDGRDDIKWKGKERCKGK